MTGQIRTHAHTHPIQSMHARLLVRQHVRIITIIIVTERNEIGLSRNHFIDGILV